MAASHTESAPIFGAPPRPVIRPLPAVELRPCASISDVPPDEEVDEHLVRRPVRARI